MDHLAHDLTVALEESESCGPISFESGRKWGMRRRTRSAGNLHLYVSKSGDIRSDDSSSSNSELMPSEKQSTRHLSSFHQSDSDEMVVARALSNRNSLRMKHPLHNFFRGRYNRFGVSYSLESDSFNEHSPARPSLRRKRKLKRISVDETPIPPCGKRKRPQGDGYKSLRQNGKIKPLHQSIVDKIEKFCQHDGENINECDAMETQCINDGCDVASESSLSWSGGEGHEGDDELTDWAPSLDNNSAVLEQSQWLAPGTDPREIRAGCRRLGDERPGFSISTGANERVARFLQDSSKTELRLGGVESDKLGQLAVLYYLDLRPEEAGGGAVLRKTERTPCMQPPQRHHGGHSAGHKRVRTLDHVIS